MEIDHNIAQGSPVAEPTEQTKRNFRCPICSRTLDTQINYLNHVRFHRKVKIFSCKFCTVKYKSLHELKAHIQSRHSSELNKCKDIIPVVDGPYLMDNIGLES